MMRRPAFLVGLGAGVLLSMGAAWLMTRPLSGALPVVCRQIAPAVRHARECRQKNCCACAAPMSVSPATCRSR